MSIFVIKDENGITVNTINAERSFVEENFQYYEEFVEEAAPQQMLSPRAWRDMELLNTDWIVPIIDHPKHAEYLVYRQQLRDWPSTEDFPLIKPVLG